MANLPPADADKRESTMQKLRFVFTGFRHAHIFSLYNAARKRTDVEIVAACEEDEKTRQELQASDKAAITHHSLESMLEKVPCDVVAVGDYYGKRGSILIEALKRGKHVISDKPICTSLAELDEIEKLARAGNLSVGCQLDMRDSGVLLEVRRLIREGEIGTVHAISFGGQHPLLYGTRPNWYFEQGKHGGTINDIAIHALDAIPWLTGLEFARIEAARAWNARLPQAPFFQDAAQMLLTMNNGCGVLGDVSYLAPDSCGYSIEQYWRMTFWGSKGLVESNYKAENVMLCRNDATAPQLLPPQAGLAGGYLEAFLHEIRGEKQALHLSSSEVFRASRVALLVQGAADKRLKEV